MKSLFKVLFLSIGMLLFYPIILVVFLLYALISSIEVLVETIKDDNI